MQKPYNLRKSLVSKAICFLDKTKVYAIQGINPGGIYQALWCRDAAYILRDWFLSGVDFDQIIRHIVLIWSHQIIPGHEKVIYGRGSPRTKFLYSVANLQIEKSFEGALPTTIFSSGFCEVYGENPDIDSNALMISTTSWILYRYLEDNQVLSESQHAAASSCADLSSSNYDLKTITQYISRSRCSSPASNQLESTIDFVLPRMLKSANYLLGRDLDDDGLLEQDYNEDWMDTILRCGKIVYSQASWILALKHLSLLLRKLGNHTKACKLEQLSYKVTNAIEQKLWSEQRKCHADVQDIIMPNPDNYTSFLTQDVSLYIVAITEGTANKVYKGCDYGENKNNPALYTPPLSIDQNLLHSRAYSTLNSLRDILWKDSWPMVIESPLSITGPKFLKAYQYHNYTFWPWMTGIEILARSRYKRIKECDLLLSKITSQDNPYIYSFYEWVNPLTSKGDGAYPFRTGISAIRIAIFEILDGLISDSYFC